MAPWSQELPPRRYVEPVVPSCGAGFQDFGDNIECTVYVGEEKSLGFPCHLPPQPWYACGGRWQGKPRDGRLYVRKEKKIVEVDQDFDERLYVRVWNKFF